MWESFLFQSLCFLWYSIRCCPCSSLLWGCDRESTAKYILWHLFNLWVDQQRLLLTNCLFIYYYIVKQTLLVTPWNSFYKHFITSNSVSFCLFLFFETQSHYVVKADLKLTVNFLPQSLEYCYYRHVPLCMAQNCLFNLKITWLNEVTTFNIDLFILKFLHVTKT